MTFAKASDVEVELGRPASSTAETAQWDAWIARVERRIVRSFKLAGFDLTEQVALDEPTEQDVVDVEVAAVIRKIQNPTWGQTSVTVSHAIDDASGSQTSRSEGNTLADPLDLLASEIDGLLPASRRRSGVFSVMPS